MSKKHASASVGKDYPLSFLFGPPRTPRNPKLSASPLANRKQAFCEKDLVAEDTLKE